MSKAEIYDDPIWEYTLASRLQPYLNEVRKFWNNIDKLTPDNIGTYNIEGEEVPPGLMYRICSTPVRSPVKHVQVFPFIPSAYLQIVGVPGGTVKMISRVCYGDKFKLEEFTVIEKSRLSEMYNQGQVLIFVPTSIYEGRQGLGKYVYLTLPEMAALANGDVIQSVKLKINKYI